MKTNNVLPTLLLIAIMILFPVLLMGQGTFFLDANGVTIRCPGALPGETGTVAGIEYEAVDRDLLIQRRNEEADLSLVCTTPVTDMRGMFVSAGIFNQDIGSWDVSNVTNMSNMFFDAGEFNQDIGGWDVSNVTNMSYMFYNAYTFNQDIGGWDVGNVRNLTGMFFYASGFNQDIGGWDVKNVTTMTSMFTGAGSFNQDISGWDVGNVTYIHRMFEWASSFNQDIGGWDVGNVVNMNSMFRSATSFNQDIGLWDVGNVTNMDMMFEAATSFNQDIGGWDVGNVTSMRGMFGWATSFNQDIGGWDLRILGNSGTSGMLDGSGLSIENYDATLIGWNNGRIAGSWTNSPDIGAAGLTYHAGEVARAAMIDAGWSFSGDERASGYLRLTGNEGFRMLSSPVAIDYATMLAPIWTQGAAGSNNPGGSPNIFTWDVSGGGQGSWSPLADMQDAIAPGSGFLVYVFADDDPDDPDSPHGFPKVITLEGDEHEDGVVGDVNPQADGWTLLGNPFDATIRFADLVRDNLTDVIYVWDVNDGANGSWKTWSESAGSGDIDDGIIAGFQGFLVQNTSDGGGEVTFPESAQTLGGDFYGKQVLAGGADYGSTETGQTEAGETDSGGMQTRQAQADVIRLELSGQDMRSSSWLSFREHGSFDEVSGDAHKLAPLSQHYALLAGIKNGNLYDISILPIPQEDFAFPITAKATIGGTYTLSVTNWDVSFDQVLYLEDRLTQDVVELTAELDYELTLDAIAAKVVAPKSITDPLAWIGDGLGKSLADDEPRFVITASGPVDGEVVPELPAELVLAQNYPNPFNPSTVISYALPEQAHVSLAIYDLTGRRISTLVDEEQAPGRYDVTWDASQLASGVYLYRLESAGQTQTRRMTLIK